MNAHAAIANMRGCALANAAVELPEKDHPARRVIEECKCNVHDNLARLCRAARICAIPICWQTSFLSCLRARMSARRAFRANGPIFDLVRMGETLIAAHSR